AGSCSAHRQDDSGGSKDNSETFKVKCSKEADCSESCESQCEQMGLFQGMLFGQCDRETENCVHEQGDKSLREVVFYVRVPRPQFDELVDEDHNDQGGT